MPALQYRPLPTTRYIRLLKLLSVQPDDESKVTIELSTINIDTIKTQTTASQHGVSITYNALSYTWGSPFSTPSLKSQYTPEFDVLITVQQVGLIDGRVKVTRNLYEAFTQLWAPDRKGYLWVDALCINQHDLQERAEQVKMMGEIYASAANTIIWLGVDDPDQPTFDHLLEFALYAKERLKLEMRLSTATAAAYTGTRHEELSNRSLPQLQLEISAVVFSSVYRFFARRRYLARAWIVQEIALAQDAYLLFNNNIEGFELLSAVVELLGRNPQLTQYFIQTESQQETGGTGEEVSELLALIARRIKWHQPDVAAVHNFKEQIRLHYCPQDTHAEYLAHLEHRLTNGPSIGCSDPRDAIFSLLGYFNALFPTIETPVQPDYDTPVQQIFVATTKLLLHCLPFRSVLSGVQGLSNEASTHALPSWVPDYAHRRRGVLSITSRLSFRLIQRQATCSLATSFTAGIDKQTYPPLSVEDLNLSLFARRCSVITHSHSSRKVVAQRLTGSMVSQLFLSDLRSVLELCDAVDRDKKRACRLLESYYQVIGYESSLLGHTDKQSYYTAVRALVMHELLRAVERIEAEKDAHMAHGLQDELQAVVVLLLTLQDCQCVPPTAFLAVLQTLGPADSLPDHVQEMLRQHDLTVMLFTQSDAYSIFVTEDHLVGNIIGAVRPGDELWLICNARVPFVLRPTQDGKYTLLGEALVDHAMHGELIENGIASEPREITIV